MRRLLSIAIAVIPLVTFGQIPFSLQDRAFITSTSPLRKDLVGYWQLEESSGTRFDRSKNGNHLTSNNSVGRMAAIVGNGSLFNSSSNTFLSVSDNAAFPSGADSMTITAWVRMTTAGAARRIAAHYDFGTTNRSWFLGYDNAANRYIFRISSNGVNAVTVTATPAVVTNQWVHLRAWRNASVGTNYISVNNGAPVAAAMAEGIFNANCALTIGCDLNSGTAVEFWNGGIDEVGLWRRVLTDAEAALIYRSGVGSTFPGFYPVTPQNLQTSGSGSLVISNGFYNAFPGLVQLTNGHLITIYRRAAGHSGDDGIYLSQVSSDSGSTWGATNLVYETGTSLGVRDAEACLVDDNTLLALVNIYSITASTGLLQVIRGSVASDDSVTWGSPISVPTTLAYSTQTASKPLLLGNGNVLLPFYGKASAPADNAAFTVLSSDGGQTWSGQASVPGTSTSGYPEAGVVQLASGRIVMLIRGEPPFGYLRSVSDDNGVTWSAAEMVIPWGFPNPTASVGKPALCKISTVDGRTGIFLFGRGNWLYNPNNVYATSWNDGLKWSAFSTLTPGTPGGFMYASPVLLSSGIIGAVFATEWANPGACNIRYQAFQP